MKYNHQKQTSHGIDFKDVITDIILLCDTNYNILDSNRAADIVLGKGERLAGRTCYHVLKDRTAPCPNCPLQPTLESGKILPYSYLDKNLNEYFEERIFPVSDFNNQAKQFILTCRNISETRAIENKSLQIKKLSALGKISSGVAHDFNNILTIINGRVSMISKLTDHPEIKNHLDLIKQTIFDGADKIRGIQDFARHKSEEKLMTIDINALLSAVLKITEPKWRNESINNGIIIEPIINFEKNLYITGVESDLRNCFANVIFNAVDAMPEGGLIKISTWFKNNYAFISVKDTGIGMTNVVKEKIFDPFYTTKGDKGTGMGMSEVYGIVKRHNGFIDINSEIGVGTEFIISFPARVMAEKNIKPEVSNHFAKLSLMAVSPYQVHREYIQKICSAYEMNLIILEHHRGAFEKFQKQRPLVLITNLQYPEMAGLKLAQEVKQYKRNTVTVLIPETIISQEEQNFFTRTFDHIINPPFTLDKVKIEIGQILQSVKEKQE